MKRFSRPLLDFLSREEVEAILFAANQPTSTGRRDYAMFLTLYNTGVRVSELASIRKGDLTIGNTSFLKIHGKGRKERTVPLWKSTALVLRKRIAKSKSEPQLPLFPNRNNGFISRYGISDRLTVAVNKASTSCPSLRNKKVSPHTWRHTTAMHLLQSGVDITVIALWLGHESPSTTHIYIEADLNMKKRALAKLQNPKRPRERFIPSDALLQFLDQL